MKLCYVCALGWISTVAEIIFSYAYIHVNFTHVNKIETWYEVLCLNMKLSDIKLLRMMFHALPLFYLQT